MSRERYLCIHGHFYQPPRETPWLETVEVQDSAHPYHDWNEAVTAECYEPNASARISTWDGKILDIRNNYQKLSFNFGPTLLQWLEDRRPDVYADILQADKMSAAERGGHGNALAQAFNHTILPLATEREKRLQIDWGMEDFRHRFRRDPDGMWMPETAVDLKTLDAMAEAGIQFTVLAPRQARRWRSLSDSSGWVACDGGRIDPTRPYACTLPSGRVIVLFFYDGPISQAVAFEGLLNDGNHFAHRLMQGFSDKRPWEQFLSIATDGESYGHHHSHGEMALAYAMHVVEREGWAKLTNFAEFLSTHSPEAEAQIWDNSSWSCVHGVERWRSDCGCNSGQTGGHQAWREGLRKAFRLLADHAEAVYDREAAAFFKEPEAALNDYIRVILDRSQDSLEAYFSDHLSGPLTGDPNTPRRLLEMMRNAQLMFTSCAWFFDEVSGIETTQNMKYAARVLQLIHPWEPQLEKEYLEILRQSPSNIHEFGNAAEVYRRFVKPGVIDLYRVIAHHAMCSIEEELNETHHLFCYEVTERDSSIAAIDRTLLKICRLSARSLIDGEHVEACALVLRMSGSDFRCSITGSLPPHRLEAIRSQIMETQASGTFTELIRAIDEHFGRNYYTLDDIFADGKRELLQSLTRKSFARFDDSIRLIYEENQKFMDYLLEVGAPLPQGFLSAADFVLKTEMIHALEEFVINGGSPEKMLELAKLIRRYRIHVQDPYLCGKFHMATTRVFERLAMEPDLALISTAKALLTVLKTLALHINLRKERNIVFALVHRRPLPAYLERESPVISGDLSAILSALQELARQMNLETEPIGKTLGQPTQQLSTGGSSEAILRMGMK